MTLNEWLTERSSAKVTKTALLRSLAIDSGVSYQTLANVSRGAKLEKYDLAKAVSLATEGLVSIKELCE